MYTSQHTMYIRISIDKTDSHFSRIRGNLKHAAQHQLTHHFQRLFHFISELLLELVESDSGVRHWPTSVKLVLELLGTQSTLCFKRGQHFCQDSLNRRHHLEMEGGGGRGRARGGNRMGE